MFRALIIALSLCIALAFSVTAFADPGKSVGSVVVNAGNSVYDRGTSIAANTHDRLTGIARNTFGLFNPCLDLVKATAGLALSPLSMPFEYWGNDKAKRVSKKSAASIPVPKKPELPK